jgi:hypothetical protein
LLGIAVIHLSAFVFVLRRVSQWKVLWFVALFPPENIAIDMAVSAIGQTLVSTRRRQRTD